MPVDNAITEQKTPRAAIYVRVSSPDQVDNFSLEAQEEAAREYVQSQGWQVQRVYADEGLSARTAERPAFKMMLRDSRLHQFELIVVHKLDRFFRNLSQLLQYVQQLDERGVRLVSISEDIDFSSASGRMLLTSIGMISEFYSNNLREETAKGKRQRALNGLWNSCIPFGYQRGECAACADPNYNGPCPNPGAGGICPAQLMVPHPQNAVAVRQAFELHAQGRSYQEVADFLNGQDCQPHTRDDERSLDHFSKETVRSMLQNETYLGFVKYKGELYPGQHEALVDLSLFGRSQQVRRDAAVARSKPGKRRHYLLSGLVRCASCGFKMRGVTDHLKEGEVRFYRDAANERGQDCGQSRVRAEAIETQVAKALASLEFPVHWRTRIAQLAQATPEVERLERERRMLRSKEKRLRRLFLRDDISEAEYERKQQQLERQRVRLNQQKTSIDVDAHGLAGDFERLWEELSPTERRQVVQATIKAVYVRGEEVDRIEFHRPFAALV